MCTLCDQRAGHRFEIAETTDGLGLYGLSIAPAELLNESSVGVTRRATATDEVLDYYLHTPGGMVSVSGSGFGRNGPVACYAGSDQDYFNSMVRRLDSIIDLDFRRVASASSADVDITTIQRLI